MKANADTKVTQAMKKIEKVFGSLPEKEQVMLWCRMILANPDLLEATAKHENCTAKEIKRIAYIYLRSQDALS